MAQKKRHIETNDDENSNSRNRVSPFCRSLSSVLCSWQLGSIVIGVRHLSELAESLPSGCPCLRLVGLDQLGEVAAAPNTWS